MPTLKAGPQASTHAPPSAPWRCVPGAQKHRQTTRRIALVPKTPIRVSTCTVPDYPRWPAVRLSAGGSQEFQFGQPHAWNFRSLSPCLRRLRDRKVRCSPGGRGFSRRPSHPHRAGRPSGRGSRCGRGPARRKSADAGQPPYRDGRG